MKEAIKARIEKELEINKNKISEERLNIIAADFVEVEDCESELYTDQKMVEMEVGIEEMIVKMGGSIDR